MKILSKPVWAEGMYLGPQNFQAQSRYFEDSLRFLTHCLWPDAFGFSSLQIDDDQLRNGAIQLRHAKGLFEDGLAFDLPASDEAPASRPFAALFAPAADHLTLYLAVPSDAPEGRNTSLAESPELYRYQAIYRSLPDEGTGRDARLIQLGQKNLRLLTEEELTDRFVSLPLARVVRDGSGRFEADPTFMPPSLRIPASANLSILLQRLVGILEEKSSALERDGQDQGPGGFQAGLSARQVSQFWFLHALNSSVSSLRHFLLTSHAHPRDLYREMLRLAGALCTFGFEVHPRSLPVYDHRDPGACFIALDEHIQRHLQIVMPSKAITIPLTLKDNFFQGEIRDERCIGPSRWLLEVRADARAGMGEADLIATVPRLVKVCAARFVPGLVQRALPGMVLRHLPVPPADIAANVESQYFVVERTSPCWDHVVITRQVGVYIPAEIPSAELKILVLLNT
jgi:type VI secretion system protein ImpJ